MVNDCFLLSLFSYAFFVSSHAALRKNYMSKDTGDLSSTPVSDNKLCYTPEWDDDVHPHQFHMGFSPGVHGRGIFGVATGLTINFSFQFYLCMLVNQRENLTFGQKSHRAFWMLLCYNSKTISLLIAVTITLMLHMNKSYRLLTKIFSLRLKLTIWHPTILKQCSR